MDKTNLIRSISKKLFKTALLPKRSNLTEKELKAQESKIGSSIFGPLKPNERREFFNDNEKSWFFHQELADSRGTIHSITIHYEIHPHGILKVSSQPGMNSEFLQGEELDNFISAVEIYYQRVMREIYGVEPVLGKNI